MFKDSFLGLLIDIGNSTTVFAKTDSKMFFDVEAVSTADFKATFDHSFFKTFDKIVISSVVPEIDSLFFSLSAVVFLNHNTIPLLHLNLNAPEQVGADRLVNALAAFQLYKRQTLIVDSGTAITFCLVDVEGVYQGGLILPGMGIASKALHDYTAKIPAIFVQKQESLLGKNTEEAVQAGLYFGYQDMINGLIRRYRGEYPGLFVVGTGSGISLFEFDLDLDEIEPNLTLKGLLSAFKCLIA